MPDPTAPQKCDITILCRGCEADELKGARGYRILPGWISIICADGTEVNFATGDGPDCIVQFSVKPVERLQIVTPGGNGVMRPC